MRIEISHQILFGKNNYFITRDGKVKNINSNRYLKPFNTCGYLSVKLTNGKKICKNYLVHRLIALAFIPNPNNYPTVDHINNNKRDNNINNLRWATVPKILIKTVE